MEKGAIISRCEKYRYSLWRIWDHKKPLIGWIGLNPSTADNKKDDRTICRCINFSKSWESGGLYMMNLFAYRATKPNNMIKTNDPVGSDNDQHLSQLPRRVQKIIVCWGNKGEYNNRANQVLKLLKENVYCLDINKSGEPKHPLYIKTDTLPQLYR